MKARIRGIGTAVPDGRVSQERALELALPLCYESGRKRRLISTLYRRSGVLSRHSVLIEPGTGGIVTQSFYPAAACTGDRGPSTGARMRRYSEQAGTLAVRSARAALASARASPESVTHLITVSCTGFAAPGVDAEIIGDLGLGRGVARTHIGFMGCHGAMNALRMAGAAIGDDPAASVLVTAVELCSLHQQYGWLRERVVSNALFADGAASVVVDADRGAASPALLAMTGSTIIPESRELMGWRIGDHGFEMCLSARVPDAIRENLGPWLDGWLRSAGIASSDVGAWAVHPGGPSILTATAEALGLEEEAIAPSRSVLSGFGNMSSPTILFILERLIRARAPGPWVALGFGPGLAIEAALITPA